MQGIVSMCKLLFTSPAPHPSGLADVVHLPEHLPCSFEKHTKIDRGLDKIFPAALSDKYMSLVIRINQLDALQHMLLAM